MAKRTTKVKLWYFCMSDDVEVGFSRNKLTIYYRICLQVGIFDKVNLVFVTLLYPKRFLNLQDGSTL